MLIYIIILVLIIIIFYNFRYIKLNLISSYTLGACYLLLPPCFEDKKTVVYFYLDEKYIKNFKRTINSILDQSHRTSGIYVSSQEDLPEYISEVAITKKQSKQDHFRNAIIKEKESTTSILFLKPNFFYSKNFIFDVVNADSQASSPVIHQEYILIKPSMFSLQIDKKIFFKENNYINLFLL